MASKPSTNTAVGKYNKRAATAPDQVPSITSRKKNKRTKISKDAKENQEEITPQDSSGEVELEKEECLVKLLSKLDENLLAIRAIIEWHPPNADIQKTARNAWKRIKS
jgi:hypothetical protein